MRTNNNNKETRTHTRTYRLQEAGEDEGARRARQDRANPAYIPRQHLMQVWRMGRSQPSQRHRGGHGVACDLAVWCGL